MLRVEETGQEVQIAIKLLDSLHKLPDQNSIWLLQPIASGCVSVVAVAIIVALVFLACALEFPVGLFKLRDLCGQLCIVSFLIMRCT